MSALEQVMRVLRGVIRGHGVPPRKQRTRDMPIVAIEPPAQVHLAIPGLQAVVAPGQAVGAGALVARTPERSRFQRRLHASLTGVVKTVDAQEIVLEGRVPDPLDVAHSEPEWIAPEAIGDTAREAGLIGMGGAMFPSYVKLTRATPIEVVLINGCESEPYLTCDHRVLVEHADEVACGMALAMRASGASRGLVIDRETYYPGGYERLLIRDVLGREVPARRLPRDVGTLVLNVQSARALHQAVCLGRPLIERVVTVDGGAVGRPGNYRVPIGTPVGHLLRACETDLDRAAVILTGGPMMGRPATLTTPVTGGTGGVLALTAEELADTHTEPCIRCGRCLDVCPYELPAVLLVEQPHKSVLGCVECGACQFVCPARQPLVAGLRKAKAVVTAWD